MHLGDKHLSFCQSWSVTMDREQCICQSIVRALHSGLVPSRGLDRIAVGREGELEQLRHDLEFCQNGGAWVRYVSGDYGVGKTFLCSLLREEAWHMGFVVAAVDLGRDAPFHRFEAIYQRIMDGMRTDHFREVPAFEFIVQEWLFNLEKVVQRSMGLNPLHPNHRGEISTIVARRIKEQLGELRIYDSSFANALRGYYRASQQGDEVVSAAVAGWLKGDQNIPVELRKEFHIRGGVDRDNAFDFLQAMAALVVHVGYAGLLIIFDEAELIRGISRIDSRHAAYENMRFLMDKAAQGEFAHCGFLLAGTEDLFNDELRGVASYQALYNRLQPERSRRQTKDFQHPLIALAGFDHVKLYEVARRVRQVHGIAYAWNANERLSDERLKHLIEQTAARFGEKFHTVPRGFLKGLVDILHALRQNPQSSAAEILAGGIDASRIEEVERVEAHLLDDA
jgi:BREX system ATP-binding protein BrxC/D